MALNESAVIWITDKAGVVIEEYNGTYSLKAVRKYQSQRVDKVSYDWVKRDVWNKETRQWETPPRANAAMGVILGDREQAIASLLKLLESLGWVVPESVVPEPSDDDGPPF